MFVRQNQQQFRNSNADVQIFYASQANGSGTKGQSWNKPVGVSHIYMMLIGPGGSGNTSTSGGGSGAVTVWLGAAQNVPDSLIIQPQTTSISYIYYRTSSTTTVTLLSAAGGSGITGATAMTPNQFCNMGFFQSVAGQSGVGDSVTASATTFLSAGGGSAPSTGNYRYVINGPSWGNNGYFQFQPIMVGVGAAGGNPTGSGVTNAAYGCGGDFTGGTPGGPGLAIIASW